MRRIAHIGILMAAFLALAGTPVRAEELSAAASLSRNVTEAGAPVTLTFSVTGTRSAEPPEDIRVDGLDIRYADKSWSLQSQNFRQVTASVSHNYQVIARSPGEYTIPSQRIRAGRYVLVTNPVTLRVVPSTSSARTRSQNAPATDDTALGEIASAELIVPKDTAYVGEAIPVEVRFYLDANVRFQANTNPALTGEGFTAAPFSEPRRDRVSRDGKVYEVVIYQTMLTPAKAGELSLGPAEMNLTAAIPRARAQIPHFGNDDFFNDDFFNNAFSAFAVNREISVRTDTQKLEVKALPREGQPQNFSGAIGKFELKTTAGARQLKIGDPVTLDVVVSGRGNFDRMGEPTLETGAGWRAYPPSIKFKPDDTLGMSGTKTFEFAVIPSQNETTLPEAEFSYFDPAAEKYVTLRSEPIDVTVTGTPQINASPTPGATAQAAATPTPAPDEPLAKRDVHYILTGPAKWGPPVKALYRQPWFWAAQAVPLLALFAWLAIAIQRRRAGDVAAREAAALRSRSARCQRALLEDGLSPHELYENAAEVIRIETALNTGRAPSVIHAADAVDSRNLDPETAEGVRRIFALRDEMAYAGGGGPGGADHDDIRHTINQFLAAK